MPSDHAPSPLKLIRVRDKNIWAFDTTKTRPDQTRPPYVNGTAKQMHQHAPCHNGQRHADEARAFNRNILRRRPPMPSRSGPRQAPGWSGEGERDLFGKQLKPAGQP